MEPWTMEAPSPTAMALEEGAGFEAAMLHLEDNPTRLRELLKLGEKETLTYLRDKEIQYRKALLGLLVRGVAEEEAKEGALASLVPMGPTRHKGIALPGHSLRVRTLRRVVQSAPRTWPTETIASSPTT